MYGLHKPHNVNSRWVSQRLPKCHRLLGSILRFVLSHWFGKIWCPRGDPAKLHVSWRWRLILARMKPQGDGLLVVMMMLLLLPLLLQLLFH